jgi:hypothetical protein
MKTLYVAERRGGGGLRTSLGPSWKFTFVTAPAARRPQSRLHCL